MDDAPLRTCRLPSTQLHRHLAVSPFDTSRLMGPASIADPGCLLDARNDPDLLLARRRVDPEGAFAAHHIRSRLRCVVRVGEDHLLPGALLDFGGRRERWRDFEIGRASCRERVWISVAGVCFKKKIWVHGVVGGY